MNENCALPQFFNQKQFWKFINSSDENIWSDKEKYFKACFLEKQI